MSATKTELDKRVAARLGMPHKEVAEVTFEFIEMVRHILVEEGVISVPRLGRLTVGHTRREGTFNATEGTFKKGERGKERVVPVTGQLRVHFAKSLHLKEELEKHHGKIWRR